MSSLQIDVTYKKKSEADKVVYIDKRKLRAQQTPREKLIRSLEESMEKIGVLHNTDFIKELLRIKNIEQLNKPLVCIVYKYFESRDFSLEEVFKNFDEDFEEQLNLISKFDLFKKLKSSENIYKFRQDFCCYLFLIYEFTEFSEEEDYSSYENFNDSNFSFNEEENV